MVSDNINYETTKNQLSRIIIVEGPQGVGKGTITNLLREQMPYSNLFRLTGLEDKSPRAKNKVYEMHKYVLDVMKSTKDINVNYIIDRCFLSEDIYCELGLKSYTFKGRTDKLAKQLNDLGNYYHIQFVILTAQAEDFKVRLLRDKPLYAGVEFKVDNSMNQQRMYIQRTYYLKGKCPNVDFCFVNTSNVSPQDIVNDIINYKVGI